MTGPELFATDEPHDWNLGRARLPLTAAGMLLVVVGSWSPWAAFAGYPGKMTLAQPGGVRLYTLVLAAFGVLGFVRLAGRRRAGMLAAGFIAGIALYNIIAIERQGGGLANVSYGAWLTLAGAALLFGGMYSLAAEESDATPDLPEGSSWLQLAAVVVLLGVGLMAVVEAFAIDASSQFLGFLGFVSAVILGLSRLGVVAWLVRATDRHQALTLAAAFVTTVAFPFTQNGNDYWIRVAASVGVFAAAAVGLNIVVGLAGLLDLGYVAFFGVGAYIGASYSGAPTSNAHVHLPFILVLLLGACVAALFGVLIGAPTLRLRGDYLAIVTLAFGEIFRISANNLDGQAGPKLTNGPNGIPGIPNLRIPGVDFGHAHTVFGIRLSYFTNYFYAELLLLVLVMVVFVRLNRSRIGRAWIAIREDETAAAAMGVNTVRLKLLAFAIGAFLAGAAGTLNSHLTTQVDPTSYTFNESILLLAAVVLGGMGTIAGAILGSSALLVLPEKLRFFKEKRILIFGLALVLMMRFRPEGMVPNRRRQREFHEEGGGADSMSAPPGAPVAST